jgi:hypothetical protein
VSVVDLCIRIAAHRWRLEPGADQVREWQGELHELAVEEGVSPGARAYRRLRFALSLAGARPVPPPGAAARDWLDRPAGLIRLLRPVLILIGVPIGAVALTWGTGSDPAGSIVSYLLDLPTLLFVSYLLTGPVAALVVARWTGRHEPLLAAARPAVRAVAVPVLLAVGVVVVYDRPSGARTGSPHEPVAVMLVVAAWTLAAVALGLAATFTPVLASGTAALQWPGWLDGVRQAAALLSVLGLLLAAVTWSPARRVADRRRKAAAGLAVVAAYCPAGLFTMGGWHVISEPAPGALAAATAAVTGLLAALAAAGAVAARREALRPGAAAVLVAGVGLGVAALGSLSNGNGDASSLVLLASMLSQVSGIALVLMVWRIARGRPPHRLRRTLIWTAVWLSVLLTGAAGTLERVAGFVGKLGSGDLRGLPAASVPSTLVVALAVAVLLAARLVRTTPGLDRGATR